ncbi:ABC transporter substrate-binding protein [Clostridium sp. YIM B02551]|uniref:ABC transporter substrate-binding protein n=1 Tax=Clostridium sp. YIM B02551 TaxID=2910679 RepID=UPI001EEC1AC9|nr:ABC transporter substrate-binding protein [Clostridium sp. YIM B02551]
MKKIICILVFIMISAQLISCEKVQETKEYGSPSNRINYGVSKIPNDLSSYDDTVTRTLMGALFEGLIYKSSDGKIVPQLSDSYSVDKNQLEYTFKIRRDIYWSNGEKITSTDFVNFFKEYVDNCKSLDDLKELSAVYGIKEYFTNKKDFNKTVAIMADGEYLKIRLNFKDDNFISALALPKYKLRKDFTKLKNYRNSFKDLIYSGSYKISDVKEDIITLEKNKYYYNKDNGVNTINLVIQNNSEYALASFETNKIDIMEEPPINYLQKLRERQEVIEYPYNDVKFIAYNCQEKSTFSDAKLREDFYEYIQGLISDDKFSERISGTQVLSFSDNSEKEGKSLRSEPKSSLMELKSVTIYAEDNDTNKEFLKYVTEEAKKDNLIIYYKLFPMDDLIEELKKGNYSMYIDDFDEDSGMTNKFTEEALKSSKGNGDLSKSQVLENSKKDFVRVPMFRKNKVIVKKSYIQEIEEDFYGDVILNSLKLMNNTSV